MNHSGAKRGEACGRVVVRQVVSAVSAVEVGDADALVADTAVGGNAIGTLWTVVDVAVHLSAAAGALGQYRLPQEKIQHRADAALQHDTQQNPEPLTHVAARSVLADIADHQHVDGNQCAPRSPEIDMHGKGAVVVGMQHEKEKILNADEGHEGQNDRPSRNEGEFFAD